MLFTTVYTFGMTSGAQAQDSNSDPFAPEKDSYIAAKGCWCVKNEDLVKAAFAMKFSKLQLELKDKEMQQRLDALSQGCTLKMETSREWYDAQLEVTRKGCAAQIDIVLDQTKTLVSSMTEANVERLRATTGLFSPPRVEWYRHPLFVGVTAGILGFGVGILIGAAIER